MEDDLTFPQIIDGLSAPIATTTADGRVDFANRQLLDYLGMSLEELKNWETSGAIHPDDLPRVVTAWRQSVERGEPYEAEQRIRRADGTYQWVRVRGLPLRDTHNRILRWCVLLADIAERKRAEALLDGEKRLLEMVASGCPLEEVLEATCGIVDTLVSNSACSMLLIDPNGKFRHGAGPTLPPGYDGTVNGAPVACEAGPCGTAASLKEQVIVPDLASDSRWVGLGWRALALEHGLRSVCSTPIVSLHGKVLGTFAVYRRDPGPPSALLRDLIARFTHIASIAIERAISENNLRERERESRLVVDTIPGLVSTFSPSGEIEILNHRLLEYFGKPLEEMRRWEENDVIHPEDLPRVIRLLAQAIASEEPLEYEARLRRFDAVYRWFQVRALPARESTGRVVRWYTLITDIDDLKCAEDTLRGSERSLKLIVDTIPGLVATLTPRGEVEAVNEQVLAYCGRTMEELKQWGSSDIVHPEDLPRAIQIVSDAIKSGDAYEIVERLRRFDGVYRWFQVRGLPLRDSDGRTVRWYVLLTDIDERKQAEEKLRRSEWSLLEAQRLGHSGSWSLDISSGRVTTSPEMFRTFGVKPGEDCSSPDFWFNRIHPEDRKRVRDLFERCVVEKSDYEAEYRLLLPGGTINYQHSIGRPIVNEKGDLMEFVGTAIDVTEQVKATTELEKAFAEIKILKDQLAKENIALREEIDKASMFEEIVGTSRALHSVLSRLAKVAPADSTVLITGETGTGKELVARAIHKRSHRSARAFVGVNCAAIPRDLIASELFGHEKGAFTGATQQRLGRFELAGGGTIFLDEVGELPSETQIALLRVLQEHEFERVGGTKSIRTDVRVIAATNRDLQAAIAGGTFRRDLYYRLNVFPIDVPSLRERREDIPVLVEYFIHRYARKAGKSIRGMNAKSLELLQSYPWPGNIRELQNVIERSVIVCDTETFSIDESWLLRQPLAGEPKSRTELTLKLASQEKEMIEAALRETEGRVSGPSGAAAKLGIPGSTLDSKIRSLKINKNRFKTSDPSTDRI
jgi:PAS domain S-box-containing protein